MDPLVIALICAVVLGGVMAIATLIRQLLISWDRKSSNKAQNNVVEQETHELEKLRRELQNFDRYALHQSLRLENNQELMMYDKKIEDLFTTKKTLIDHFAKLCVNEANDLAKNNLSEARKLYYKEHREIIDKQLECNKAQIEDYQQKRNTVQGVHDSVIQQLLDEEKERNTTLDKMYLQHTAILEKVFVRHMQNIEDIAIESSKASTSSFKEMLMVPFQFLAQFFSAGIPSTSISFVHTKVDSGRTNHEDNRQELQNNDFRHYQPLFGRAKSRDVASQADEMNQRSISVQL